jgi:hypothetical protein
VSPQKSNRHAAKIAKSLEWVFSRGTASSPWLAEKSSNQQRRFSQRARPGGRPSARPTQRPGVLGGLAVRLLPSFQKMIRIEILSIS